MDEINLLMFLDTRSKECLLYIGAKAHRIQNKINKSRHSSNLPKMIFLETRITMHLDVHQIIITLEIRKWPNQNTIGMLRIWFY